MGNFKDPPKPFTLIVLKGMDLHSLVQLFFSFFFLFFNLLDLLANSMESLITCFLVVVCWLCF